MEKVNKKNPRGAGRKKSNEEMTYKHFRLPLAKRIILEESYSKKELNESFKKWIDNLIEKVIEKKI